MQELQRTTQNTQLAIVSETGGTRTRFEEAEAKIVRDLESIPARIHEVVEDKLATLRGEMHLGEDINHLVQRMVSVSSTGAAATIKQTLKAELSRAREELQREIASGVEGPMRKYVQQLVLELTAQSESQLEARVQRALTDTQADVNLRFQRQVDATSIDAKICSDLEAIPARIHEVVEDKLVDLCCEMRPGAAESIKKALESKLQCTREEIQHDFSSGVEGTMRELVQPLVMTLTAGRESQLEARRQRALINAQADVNFQCQRQADATSILREKLQRHIAHTVKQALPVDEAAIKDVILEVLQNEMNERFKLELETQNADHVDFRAPTNATIEHSVQAAATTIGNAIKIDIRSNNASPFSSHEREPTLVDAEDEDDEDKMSAEELCLQKRIQDAWRRTYLDVRRGSTVLNATGNVLSGEDVDDDDLEETTPSSTQTCDRTDFQRMQSPVGLLANNQGSQSFDLAVNGTTSPTNVVFVLLPPLLQEQEQQAIVFKIKAAN